MVYRAALDRAGRVEDFEYRYANPTACVIMRRRAADVTGATLLERLPVARGRRSFRAMCGYLKPEGRRRRNMSSADAGFTALRRSWATDLS